jgi:hypothetical protein
VREEGREGRREGGRLIHEAQERGGREGEGKKKALKTCLPYVLDHSTFLPPSLPPTHPQKAEETLKVPKLYIFAVLLFAGLSLFMFNAGAQFIVYVLPASLPICTCLSPPIPPLTNPPSLPPSVPPSLPPSPRNVVGFIFPAYASFRAIEAGDQVEAKVW